jgi:flagellar biosynthesis component FlhA
MNITKYLAIVIILAGIGIIVAAYVGSMPELQIAVTLVGLGFICLGLIQWKRERDKKQSEIKHQEIMAKLDEIKQELEKKGEPRGTGVAIADVISSGLKYYSEYMTKPDKEEKK